MTAPPELIRLREIVAAGKSASADEILAAIEAVFALVKRGRK